MSSQGNYICCFGEVLWDLLPSGKVIGGAPFNVAVHLNNLDVAAFYISRIGKDELGNEIKEWLKKKNISSQSIQTDEMNPTGTVKVTLNEQHQPSYEIVSPAAWDFISLTDEMISLVKNSRAIIFGSLACRNPVTHSTLLSLLNVAQLKIFDVNLRVPHFSQELVESLLHYADIVKMNDDELQIISSWSGLNDESEREKMNALKKKFSLQMIIVTKGGEGALLVRGEDFFRVKGFEVKVTDTVGSGDSFLAGFLKKYFEGKPMEEALAFASALGALVATYHGATPQVSEEQVLQLIQSQQE